MLLLYRKWNTPGYKKRCHLHSTMLLLYRFGQFRTVKIQSDLHSTMLLLYLIELAIPGQLDLVFTFHYASTLSQKARIRVMVPNSFTFHYASTLSGNRDIYRFEDTEFTFHYASTLSMALNNICFKYLDLHSTMLLLYLFRVISIGLTVGIYIPLCLYFIFREEVRADHKK